MNTLNRFELLRHRLFRAPARLWLPITLFLGFSLASTAVFASTYAVNIDTSSLFGTSAQLAFDVIDGGTPANSVTISSFATDGSLGSASGTGDVSGSLAGTLVLNDTVSPLNEYLAGITLGSSLSFVFEATNNAPDNPSSSPDGFSFYILTALGGDITSTGDPSGTNALLVLDISGATTAPTPYSGSNPSVPVVVTPVPIPPGLVLLLSGLPLCLRRRQKAC